MTFTLSGISEQRLLNCHPDIVRLVRAVAREMPLLVVCGARNKADQDEAVATGHSRKVWPTSRHNTTPCKAVDISPLPYGLGGNAAEARLQYLGGFVLGMASSLGLRVRWGGCWAGDHLQTPNHFPDLFHFELLD